MPNVSDLTDVALDLPSLQSTAKPAIVPPVVSTWWKVLQYRPATQKWSHAVFYSLMVLRRRLVTATVALQGNINSLLQWGELFSIDGAETVYYARSNPTTISGAYNGDVTVIKVAGPGAFVSRDSEQVVSAKKVFASGAVVGADLTVAGDFTAIGFKLDCGKYVGTPEAVAAPTEVTATRALYSATVSWTASVSTVPLKYIVEMAEIGLYTGSAPDSAIPENVTWTKIALTDSETVSVTANGLKTGAIYIFRVGAVDATGETAYSSATTPIAVLNHAV